jgi:hypothetical protein
MRKNRIKYKYHRPEKPFNIIISKDKKTKPTNRSLTNVLTCLSIKPTFERGLLVFITIRVSEPVYMTQHIASPVAKTVPAQRTLSTVNGSSCPQERIPVKS